MRTTVQTHLYRAAIAATLRARALHAAILDRTGGPAERDRGVSVIETVIITAGLAVAAIALVTIITATINRYGNVLAGLTP
jgi:hypothetical protein